MCNKSTLNFHYESNLNVSETLPWYTGVHIHCDGGGCVGFSAMFGLARGCGNFVCIPSYLPTFKENLPRNRVPHS